MDALSSLDAMFLAIEDRHTPVSIGTVAVCDGPAPTVDEVRSFLAGRMARVPRPRQRVHEPLGLLGRPVWIDDVAFDLAHHNGHLEAT